MKRNLNGFIVSFLFPFFFPTTTQAFMEVGTDLIFSGFFLGAEGNEVLVKSHNYFFFGGESFSFGPMAYYESMGSEGYDTILGGGLKIGATWFFILSGGYYKRDLSKANLDADGIGALLFVGRKITSNIRISVGGIGKSVSDGESIGKFWRFDMAPYVGLRGELF